MNSTALASARASSTARTSGRALATSVVIRMCSPRRSATTEPSIASQMNSICASSSDQIRAEFNT